MSDNDVMRDLVRAAVRAFAELNTIRRRDGVPYTSGGFKSDVPEEYFSSVVDALDNAVWAATGKSANCHPELFADLSYDQLADLRRQIYGLLS
jgi:hypothetical protein